MSAGSVAAAGEAGRQPNSYDAVRLAAALAVLFGHSFVLLGALDPVSQILVRVTGWGEKLHELAVNVFFALSGYLVTLSWLRRGDVAYFAAARVLRIFPAAILVCVLTVIGGAAFTTLPLAEYATAEGTWRFLVRNILLMKIEYHLPGVFAENPFPRVVNGSLWTLPYELRLYALTALLGLAGVLRRRWAFNLLFGLAVLDYLLPQVALMRDGETGWRLWLHFFGGAALAVNRDRVRPHGRVTLALVALALVTAGLAPAALHKLACVAATVFATHWIGQAGGLGRFDPGRRGDLSYGVYLYACPVQQGLIALAPAAWNGWSLTVAALPIVFVLAALSWHLVERPALARKDAAAASIHAGLRRLRALAWRRPATPPAGR
ncbi:MAG TPA: acyltransferase [Acetobacteraceae bacterium]|nr:acyltransferase [Acetobacteraceae bacterium]